VMWAAFSLDTVTTTISRWIVAPIALWLLPRHVRAIERSRRTSTTMGKTIITEGD
jgi:hypothetical protein